MAGNASFPGLVHFARLPVDEGATTARPPTKDEIEKLLAVAPHYGIEILGPPGALPD